MENYLYFTEGTVGSGSGANATTEAMCFPCSRLAGVSPILVTTTGVYFDSALNDVDDAGGTGDLITITHADTSASTGHRCQIIAKAVAQACNAHPHSPGLVSIIDFDNSVFYDGIKDIKSDASFGIVQTLDT